MNPARYESLVLPSGFRLAVATLPESECAAFSVHVAAGSRDDLPGLAGTAHFVEHMVFKGTQRRDARAISLEAEDAGGSLNACTTEDQVVYEARGDADALPLLADITADIVWHAAFPEREIPLEREVIAEEIVMYRESPGDHIGDLISLALWSPHPLGESVSGSEDSIARIQKIAPSRSIERRAEASARIPSRTASPSWKRSWWRCTMEPAPWSARRQFQRASPRQTRLKQPLWRDRWRKPSSAQTSSPFPKRA